MKIKSLLLAAAAFTAMSANAEITMSVADIDITSADQCNQPIAISLMLNNSDFEGVTSSANSFANCWWKNIEIHMTLPDCLYPTMYYDEEEGEEYYDKAGANVRKKTGAPVVTYSNNYETATHPNYKVVGANITATPTGNGEIYVFYVKVVNGDRAALENGSYPIKAYAKGIYATADLMDQAWEFGTDEERPEIGNLNIDLPTVAVNDIDATKAVASVKYYNAAGMASDTAFDGINIVVTKYADGSQSTAKIVK